jgi:nucleoside-diphosphate-sugar epimerase
MTTLITGGAGFIGRRLAQELALRGEDVVIFDRAPTEPFPDAAAGTITSVTGDLTNWSEVLGVVQNYGIRTIFHMAALLSALSEANPHAGITTNAFGTYYVLEAARLFGVRKVIFTSSMGVYNVSQDTIVTEETPQRPAIMYGLTKVFGELLGLYYVRKFGMDFRGLRFPQLLGPGVRSAGFGQYTTKAIEAAILGDPFEVWVPEETIIPIMYIKDALRSLLMVHDAPEERLLTRVYNVGQIMPAPTAFDIVTAVKGHFPEARITFKPDPNAMKVLAAIPRIIKGDTAAQEWGWSVSYSLEDAVKDFIAEFKGRA